MADLVAYRLAGTPSVSQPASSRSATTASRGGVMAARSAQRSCRVVGHASSMAGWDMADDGPWPTAPTTIVVDATEVDDALVEGARTGR